MEQKNRWVNLIFLVVLLSMLGALAIYSYLGIFTRYMADDYFTAATLTKEGFWGAQAYWWQHWSGRYSFTFVITFIELFGLGVVPILPTLIISLWLFSIAWACLPLLKDLNFTNSISSSIFIASVALWLTYRSVDDYPQVVYWQTGILTYPISPILFLLAAGIAIRRSFVLVNISWAEIILWFLFAFIAGGFSETGASVQIVLLTTLLVFVFVFKNDQKNKLVPILLTALAGSFLSLLVISASPGNIIRSGDFQNMPPLTKSTISSLIETLIFIPKWIDRHTIVFVFGFLSGIFLVNFCMPERIHISNLSIVKNLVASLIFVEAGIWGGIAPVYLLRGTLPPDRVLLVPYFLVACLVIYWGCMSAVLLRSKLPKTTFFSLQWISLGLLIVFIIQGVVPFVLSQLQLVSPLQKYSALWDERHQSLLLAARNGESSISTTDFMKVQDLHELRSKLWLSGDFETIPDYWINQGAARYYGVNQIIAK